MKRGDIVDTLDKIGTKLTFISIMLDTLALDECTNKEDVRDALLKGINSNRPRYTLKEVIDEILSLDTLDEPIYKEVVRLKERAEKLLIGFAIKDFSIVDYLAPISANGRHFLKYTKWKIEKPSHAQIQEKLLPEKIEITASKNNNTPLPTEIESEQPSHTQIQDIWLPKKLNTPRARKYFSKAIEANIITQKGTGEDTYYSKKAGIYKTQLAYFLKLVFCQDEEGKDNGKQFPNDDVSTLFRTSDLRQTASAIMNNNGGKPLGYEIIDKIFM